MVPSKLIVAFLVCIITSPLLCHGERMLFLLPLSSKSMSNLFEPLAVALAERGHHLTIVGPVAFKIPPSNATQLTVFRAEEFTGDYPDPFELRKQAKLYDIPWKWQHKYCNKLYENRDFMNLVNNGSKFDLIFFNTQYHDCLAGILHRIGSPIIFMAPLPLPSPMTELFGTYLPSSFVPIFPLGDISAQLNFKQRVKNFLYNTYYSVLLDTWTRPRLEDIYRQKLGDPSIPSIQQIFQEQGSMIFMNSHYALTGPRPYLPNIVEIGGINCRPSKALPKELKEWADNAKEGFIVFSMGSIITAKSMPEYVRKAFIQTFAKLKERVLWKWDDEEGMKDLPKNVKLVKWLPQQDLLGHPNIRLFITHGGLFSTIEAAYHGVPVLGMPVFIDQDANMRQAEILGFGRKVEILDVSEAKLTPLIRTMLDDPRYAASAKERSLLFRDQMNTPLQRALFWVQYVLKHKGAYHLKSPGMNLNLLQYHCVDVVAFLVATALLTLYVLYGVFKAILKWVFATKGAGSSSRIQKKGNRNKKRL